MPVIREAVSLSQFAELIGVLPSRLIGVEMDRRGTGTVTIVLEPEDDMAQSSGTIPQLNTGGKTIGGKKGKGGKRGC
jgi:hypothetical protein